MTVICSRDGANGLAVNTAFKLRLCFYVFDGLAEEEEEEEEFIFRTKTKHKDE